MHRTVVLNVVGLTPKLLGSNTPHLKALAERGGLRQLQTVTPAVTCPAQSTFVTGNLPRDHGIVANGWYFRDLAEVWLWRQSNHLVDGEKLWEAGKKRDPRFSCAKLFWWYNMYASVDFAVTPRPMYLADGRKLPDIHSRPPELRHELQAKLGQFPLFDFWGPNANIRSSQWIADCARYVYDEHRPSLSLVYLPHLDYCLQKFGPDAPEILPELRQIDEVAGELIDHVQHDGTRVIVLSEYGVTRVSGPIHINRALREAGLIAVREELGRELIDPGACEAFAVADHQIAHVYVRDPLRVSEVSELLGSLDGIEEILGDAGKAARGLDHPRSGELIAIAKADRWFTYYYWLDDDRAPDFARCVDIHRKPGYDPAELFVDPVLRFPKLGIGWRLLKKRLGFRALMDVIPLDASMVRGSHGRVTDDPDAGPLIMTSEGALLPETPVAATDVKQLILDHVFGRP